MNALAPGNLYRRPRFSSGIVSHCIWLYSRFCLSYRDVEEQMAARAVTLTYEVVRYWCRKFGQPTPISYASGIRGLATYGTWIKCFARL